MKAGLWFLLLAGCLSRRIGLDPPDWTVGPHLPADGPTVALSWPIDARPPAQRTEFGRYYAFNLPLVTYGDANLAPGPLEALDRDLQRALPALGIATAPWDEADYRVRVFVLRHAGWRDVSDANWVSTVTGGIAGNVGKFFTPQFATVEARLRLEVRRKDGTLAALRDVSAFSVETKAMALTWQYWSLFIRSPTAEMFERAFTTVAADLSRDVAQVIDEVRSEEAVVTGLVADVPVYATLGPWDKPDSLRLLDPGDAITRAKYGAEQFSVMSGWTAERGSLVGRFGVPENTIGYDLGLSDRLTGLFDLTVLGRVNSAGLGARIGLWRSGQWASAVEGRVTADWVLFEEAPKGQFVGPWAPAYAGLNAAGSALVSWREGPFTPYARLNGTAVLREEEFDSAFLPELSEGTALGLLGAPGLELQLTPSLALGGELGFRQWWQGPATQFELVPQVALGLR